MVSGRYPRHSDLCESSFHFDYWVRLARNSPLKMRSDGASATSGSSSDIIQSLNCPYVIDARFHSVGMSHKGEILTTTFQYWLFDHSACTSVPEKLVASDRSHRGRGFPSNSDLVRLTVDFEGSSRFRYVNCLGF
jgi:hypothetical protein